MVVYAQLVNQDKTTGISSIRLSDNAEKDVVKSGLTVDDYLKKILELNPQFERVFCR